MRSRVGSRRTRQVPRAGGAIRATILVLLLGTVHASQVCTDLESPPWPLGPVEYGFGDEIPTPIGVRLIALGPVLLVAEPLVTGQALTFDNSALLFEYTELANLIEVRISLSGVAQVRVLLNGSPLNITHPRDLIGNPMLVGRVAVRVEDHMQDSIPYQTLVIEGRIGSILIEATEARLEALCVTTSTQTGARGP